MFKKSLLASSFALALLSGCSNQVKDNNLILDQEWQPDIYNIVVSHVGDVDNVRFWVRRAPTYEDGYPHALACVEVAQPLEPNRFYIANLNTYGLNQVYNCEEDYWRYSNLVDPYASREVDLSAWDPKAAQRRYSSYPVNMNTNMDGVQGMLTGHGQLRLVFSDLFPVNEYQLTNKGVQTLFEVIDNLKHLPVDELTIYGVADSSGNYKKNRVLADRRAQSVRTFLVEEGLNYMPMKLRGTVENGLSTPQQRVMQRRFVIEVRFRTDEK
ncbi:hypothetical protein AL542_15615 [Grimontia hollisae]|uniref:Outer membrane protein and related peptidoglycan-associated (Lipo)proteins n=2 Tax=Grimontia hollisae TaxID=673 RepID=A0A377HNH7_GRIHO|nr:OmpA family protein [Grimontia hollisae]AMG31618.1 hypothetical protein AL542_15615 [Grimontia hollisae]EEY72183.1 putative outer membrane protein [Grimontia hollisae CIP 101886]MDF2185993.1 OmpA family protein [Grimontia hollisae]STO45222.1 Outer membrane protein and related peptidoglycan-associated (lipo)proteins [Grimontia hollisae]STO57788.1 Outer membrane protein and related peptidoglycan-associated (lipo)proteins [Grimontia hollisae]